MNLLRPIVALGSELPWVEETARWYLKPRFYEPDVLSGSQGNIFLAEGFGEGDNVSTHACMVWERMGYRVFRLGKFKYGITNIISMRRYGNLVTNEIKRLVEQYGPFKAFVGYSMGAIACLQAQQECNDSVERIIIVGAPVGGCDLAGLAYRFMPLWPLVRQLRPGSRYLEKLLAGLTPEMRQKVICIVCQNDGIVWPKRAMLDGAVRVDSDATHLSAFVEEGVLTQIGLIADSI